MAIMGDECRKKRNGRVSMGSKDSIGRSSLSFLVLSSAPGVFTDLERCLLCCLAEEKSADYESTDSMMCSRVC